MRNKEGGRGIKEEGERRVGEERRTRMEIGERMEEEGKGRVMVRCPGLRQGVIHL